MRDQDQGRCAAHDALEAAAEILRIQGGETFVQHHDFGFLQQSTRQKDAATLALGQPPTGIADGLIARRTSRAAANKGAAIRHAAAAACID